MLSKQFITAGNAVFTVSSRTGKRYTFKIVRNAANDRFKESFFAYVLTGPDNENDFTYLGLFSPVRFDAAPTKASQFNGDSEPVRVLNWALRLIRDQRGLPEGYGIHHEGRCGRCGRRLTVPESIESGLGPECSRHFDWRQRGNTRAKEPHDAAGA